MTFLARIDNETTSKTVTVFNYGASKGNPQHSDIEFHQRNTAKIGPPILTFQQIRIPETALHQLVIAAQRVNRISDLISEGQSSILNLTSEGQTRIQNTYDTKTQEFSRPFEDYCETNATNTFAPEEPTRP